MVAVYGGLIDRVHDLLLCGVDPSMVDLSMCLAHLQSNESDFIRDLVKSSISSLDPILYGPEFRACIASVCLVKVVISQHSSHCCS